jgi:hypothetical protein
MDTITIIEGGDLAALYDNLKDAYSVRIHQAPDGSGIKVSVNNGMWTYWLGEKA